MRIVPIVILLASLVAGAVVRAQEVKTAKDAYLEAWFQETAERDFGKALQLYQRCVDLGATTDQELAAKALVRMGRIAQARGESDVATAYFERVEKEFAATKAAAEASTAKAGALAKPASEKDVAAVEEARRFLVEMLANGGGTVTSEKAATVFRVLSPKQIADEFKLRGGALHLILARLPEHAFLNECVDVADMTRDGDVVRSTAGRCSDPSIEIPERLLAAVDWRDSALASMVLGRFMDDRRVGGLAAIRRLFATSPDFARLGWLRSDVMNQLSTRTDADAADLMRELLDRFFATNPDAKRTGERIPQGLLLTDTPAGRVLRSVWPKLPAEWRFDSARASIHHSPEMPADSVETLVNDPEHRIREYGISELLLSHDAGRRSRGIEVLQREPRPWSQALLSDVGQSAQDATAWLDAANDEVKEALYFHLIAGTNSRPILPLLRRGLDRNEPQLIDALCGSSLARGPSGLELGLPANAALLTRDQNDPAGRLFRDLPTARQERLGERLARAVAALPNEQQRRTFLAAVTKHKAEITEPAIFAILAADPSPALRLEFVTGIGLDVVDDETRTRLVLDPDLLVAQAAIEKCPNEAPLVAAAPRVASALLDRFARVTTSNRFVRATRAIWPRLDLDAATADGALTLLWRTDIDVFIDAVRRGHGTRTFGVASGLWAELPLPWDLKQVLPMNATEASVPSIVATLEARRSEIGEAIRVFMIGNWVQTIRTSDSVAEWAADQLAALGAEKELSELAASGVPKERIAGVRGLLALGKKDAVRELLRTTGDPMTIAPEALRGGLAADVLALVRSGRLDLEALLRVPEVGRLPPESLAALLFPSDGPALRASLPFGIDPVVGVLAARGDEEGLMTAAKFYDSPPAVRALFGLGKATRVLDELRGLSRNAQAAAVASLASLTGIPEGGSNPQWPEFASDQDALIAQWRAALATASAPAK